MPVVDAADAEVAVTLYDFEESICCQMARLTLEEKGVSYQRRGVDIRASVNEQFEPWYVALNPKAVVPTLQVGAVVVTDTLRICETVDAELAGPPLTPSDTAQAEEMRGWMRAFMAPHYGVLLYGPTVDETGRSKTVEARYEKLIALLDELPESREVLEKRIAGNLRFRKLLADRERAAEVVEGARDLVCRMAEPLAEHAFIVGEAYTIADAFATAALARFEMHGYRSWWTGDALPAVEAYYARMQERPSWTLAGVHNAERIYTY